MDDGCLRWIRAVNSSVANIKADLICLGSINGFMEPLQTRFGPLIVFIVPVMDVVVPSGSPAILNGNAAALFQQVKLSTT